MIRVHAGAAPGIVLAVWLATAASALAADGRAETWPGRETAAPHSVVMHPAEPRAREMAQAGGTLILTVCPPGRPALGCDYDSIATAVAAARDGATIWIRRGVYEEAAVVRRNNLTIRAERGAHMRGVAVQGKAALVIKGANTVISGLECSQIWVPDGNGACIRLEDQNLVLRGVYFHDSQGGILGRGGRILIEHSVFARLGGDREIALGRSHGLYIDRGREFVLRHSRILSSKEEGHAVKSRTVTTIIEDNIIASLNGRDSRLIDIPNGGVVVIRNNVLEKGPNGSNPDLIGIGLERGRGHGRDHAVNRTLIENNTIILDDAPSARLVHVRNVPPPVMSGNTVVGGPPYRNGDNVWFADRAAAGIPPFPHLPGLRQPGKD